MEYFNYGVGLTMTNVAFNRLFDRPPRKPESRTDPERHGPRVLIQDVINEVILLMARHIRKETGQRNLCLAGGVALNCVASGSLLRERIFDRIWIQPAAGDAGGALGAALFAWHQILDKKRKTDDVNDSQRGSYLGPRYRNNEIRAYLETQKIPFTQLADDELPGKIAELINAQNVIGWFYGRWNSAPARSGPDQSSAMRDHQRCRNS